jgi:hypothetical protein
VFPSRETFGVSPVAGGCGEEASKDRFLGAGKLVALSGNASRSRSSLAVRQVLDSPFPGLISLFPIGHFQCNLFRRGSALDRIDGSNIKKVRVEVKALNMGSNGVSRGIVSLATSGQELSLS